MSREADGVKNPFRNWRSGLRSAVLFGIFAFIMWLGLSSLDHIRDVYSELCGIRIVNCPSGDDYLTFLGLCVAVTAFTLPAVVATIFWKEPY